MGRWIDVPNINSKFVDTTWCVFRKVEKIFHRNMKRKSIIVQKNNSLGEYNLIQPR